MVFAAARVADHRRQFLPGGGDVSTQWGRGYEGRRRVVGTNYAIESSMVVQTQTIHKTSQKGCNSLHS